MWAMERILPSQNGGDDRDEEAALIKLSRHQRSVLDMWVSFDTREKYVHIRPASLFCLLSSLIKCKVGRESLWMLGSSWGRGKRLHPMCLPACVWFLLVHGYIQSCHFNIPLRLIVPALDQRFPLKTSLVSPAHLMLAVKSIIRASTTISQDFTVSFATRCPLSLYSASLQPA